MTRRLLMGVALALSIAAPVSAQLFGVVFDPTNYANALKSGAADAIVSSARMQQQYMQLVAAY